MKVIDWLKRTFTPSEKRSMTLRDADGWLELTGGRTRSGAVITPETALGHPAVLGAVRLLAELTASLPLITYERTRDGRRRATSHPVYRLLHAEPNPIQTPFVFKETITLHLLTHGRAPVQIVRDGNRPVALWPLHPSRVTLDATANFVYKVSTPDGLRTFLPEDIIDIIMLSDDGLNGRSPIHLAREAIGAALAAEEFAADHFANNAQPSGILEHPGRLTPEAAERLKRSWQAAHGGRGRQGTAVLEEGASFKPLSATATEAQLIEARQHSMRAIASALRIPPHLLDPTVRGAYANVETQSLEFLTFSLQPLLTRIEEALQRRLFDADEPFYVEFLVDGLLRSDTLNRYTAYQTAIFAGWMDPEEVRQKENLPPRTARRSARSQSQTFETRAGFKDEHESPLHLHLEAAFRDVVSREVREVRAIVNRLAGNRADPNRLAEELRRYYAGAIAWITNRLLAPFTDGVKDGTERGLADVLGAAAAGILGPLDEDAARKTAKRVQEDVTDELLKAAVEEHVGISEKTLIDAAQSATSDEDLLEAVGRVFDEWTQHRPRRAAQIQAAVIANESALAVYRQTGVRRLRWVANPDACDFCQALDGAVVGIEEPFFGTGGYADRIRPPAHLGCNCTIEVEG